MLLIGYWLVVTSSWFVWGFDFFVEFAVGLVGCVCFLLLGIPILGDGFMILAHVYCFG